MSPNRMLAILAFTIFVAASSASPVRYYNTTSFEVPLDHFGFASNHTFNIRYLFNDTYWDKHGGGPIFFYTGNEGQIELFAAHTGFMWDIAEQFRARIVFAEHRYYGKSMPFGDKSLNPENLGYLTSSQALADYADLVQYLQGGGITPKYPVIAFGGSYGGMLAAYFRMKYPHLVTGAIAASAPVHQFTDMVPCDAFNRIVTSSFNIANSNCVSNIRKSWALIRNYTATAEGKKNISADWKLCKPLANSSDVETLVGYLATMYTTLAMVNYPYENDFLMPLPANPVKTSCDLLEEPLNGKPLIEAIGDVVNLFNNYTGKAKCVNVTAGADGDLDAAGWDYQACTEMVMPFCSTGVTDMFEPLDAAAANKAFLDRCKKKFHVAPSPRLAYIEYGGNNLAAASNIVFSNGLLDPWASGGVLTSISDSVKAIIIVEGAHHLDLMQAHKDDPFSVVEARNLHKDNIRKWIHEFRVLRRHLRT